MLKKLQDSDSKAHPFYMPEIDTSSFFMQAHLHRLKLFFDNLGQQRSDLYQQIMETSLCQLTPVEVKKIFKKPQPQIWAS